MSRYVRDYDGIGKMLRAEGTAGGIATNLERRALRVWTRARDLSRQDTGTYRNAWRIQSIPRGGVAHDRIELQVYNDDEAAPFNEFGNGHNTPPHTLLRALSRAGGLASDK